MSNRDSDLCQCGHIQSMHSADYGRHCKVYNCPCSFFDPVISRMTGAQAVAGQKNDDVQRLLQELADLNRRQLELNVGIASSLIKLRELIGK